MGRKKSRRRRWTYRILTTAGVVMLLSVVLPLTMNALPPSFGYFSARNWRLPVPNDGRPLPTIGGVSDRSRVEPLLSRVSSSLIGRETTVRCWSKEDWRYRRYGGYWSSRTGTVHLSPRVCSELVQLVYLHKPVRTFNSELDLATAVKALAHESMHAAGHYDEAIATCYGLQVLGDLAERLGATSSEGRELASLYWRESYPSMRNSYRSRECRNGGGLDIRPDDALWP